MGSISSSIFCTWVSWHGIGKKSWEERKSKTLILSVSSSMLVTVKVVKMAKKIDHYDIVTLNIVTHHLVPLLLALRGQDHGADCAWALGLHIIVIFNFSSLFFLIRNSFPRLTCSWQRSKLGNMIKKGRGGRDIYLLLLFSLPPLHDFHLSASFLSFLHLQRGRLLCFLEMTKGHLFTFSS